MPRCWLALICSCLLPDALRVVASELPSLAICVCIKDQAVDVREWIVYHRALGDARPPTARSSRALGLRT